MDVLLDICDTFVFDRLYATVLPVKAFISNDTLHDVGNQAYNKQVQLYYPLQPSQWASSSSWSRDYLPRQALSLFLITWLFGISMYLLGSTLLYYTIYNKQLLKHPKFLRQQIRQEIRQSLLAMPIMAILTVPFFLAEIHGYTKLYDFSPDPALQIPFGISGNVYKYIQYPFFILFTDTGIYWIHRAIHHPLIYRFVHKRHHKWIVPTPYASYAFNPVDGWLQSLPYHIFPFVFPLQKGAYLGLFVFVTVWTVLIHDAEYLSYSKLINGAACHTMHHLYFNYNYGQFTTFWDRVCWTYQTPSEKGMIVDEVEKEKKKKTR
ncbi:sterol desaturase, putative [Talaromyces stipitatus ATCC 10500]|uniref:Sterol desaturase, putative n=2 Tax=Talaromyces stipitatus (strain ATCC 10500 / CBS 375.48 / QM 6759 / NRRL 1006) TaxID=441959 RepID=B8MKF1_TALSN|nr:sterol desaturase, putative [Talaromyces stipitatus ATCC 10500]EED15305.1 sterol desaturase, putative [Talaromyces stipitatus ATCC 10500]